MSTAVQLQKAIEARLHEIESEAAKLRSMLNGKVQKPAAPKHRNGRRHRRGHLIPIAKKDEIHGWIIAQLQSGEKSRAEMYARATNPKTTYSTARAVPQGRRGRTAAIEKQIGNELWRAVKHRKTVVVENGKYRLAPQPRGAKDLGKLGKITMA